MERLIAIRNPRFGFRKQLTTAQTDVTIGLTAVEANSTAL